MESIGEEAPAPKQGEAFDIDSGEQSNADPDPFETNFQLESVPVALRDTLVAALCAKCDDPDPRMRETALDTLCSFGVHGFRRTEAVWKLWPDGDDIVPVLIKACKDESPAVRRKAAYSLQWFPQTGLTVPVLVALLSDDDEEVRKEAEEALEYLIREGAVGEAALSGLDEPTRRFIGILMRTMGPDEQSL